MAEKKSVKRAKRRKEDQENPELDPLDAAIAELEREFGTGSVQYGSGIFVDVGVVPTGMANVDLALGVGGLPRGRIIEVYGNESSGKTTFSLKTIASCQRKGGIVAFIDAEHALDLTWAEHQGVDITKLLLSQPDSGDDAIKMIDIMISHSIIDLIVIDSVAALVPKEELEGEVEDYNIGAQARLMSKAMRRLAGKALKTNTAIVFINQLRDVIGGFTAGFKKPESTPGGRALKFYSSIRIEIRRKGLIKGTGKHKERSIGAEASAKIVKSKVSPPFRSATFSIYFGSKYQDPDRIYGIDVTDTLVPAAKELDIITIKGSNYYFGRKKIANGKEAAYAKLRKDDDLRSAVTDAVYAAIKPSNEPPMKPSDEPKDIKDNVNDDESDESDVILDELIDTDE